MIEDRFNTIVVAGFPGIGKSHLFTKTSMTISDSDSSKFDKNYFPQNYVRHIKSLIGKKDMILVSSHEAVRKALSTEGIIYTLVYPEVGLKEEYIQRYRTRGSAELFVNLLSDNWDSWVRSCSRQQNCNRLALKKGQYLTSVLEHIMPKERYKQMVLEETERNQRMREKKLSQQDWSGKTIICKDDKSADGGLIKGEKYTVHRDLYSDIEVQIYNRILLYTKERFELVEKGIKNEV